MSHTLFSAPVNPGQKLKGDKMIWGKTYSEIMDKGRKNDIWFAWHPIRLEEDGRWVWWQKVKRFLAGSKDLTWYKYYLLSEKNT